MSEQAWFDAVYRRNYPYIKRLALSIGVTHHVRGADLWSEDMAQEAFAALLREVRKNGIPDSWNVLGALVICLKHVVGNYFQKAVNSECVFSEVWDNAPDIPVSAAEEELSFPEGMKPEEREIIYLFYYGGYSTKEIADRYGITDALCRKRLQRARDHFRELYKKSCTSTEFDGIRQGTGTKLTAGGASHV